MEDSQEPPQPIVHKTYDKGGEGGAFMCTDNMHLTSMGTLSVDSYKDKLCTSFWHPDE